MWKKPIFTPSSGGEKVAWALSSRLSLVACGLTSLRWAMQAVSLAEVGGLKPGVNVDVDQETAALIYAGLLEPKDDPQIQAAVEALK